MIDDVADRWQAAWSARDPAAFAALCAPDVHYEDPLTEVPVHGPAAVGDHARRLWTGFPDAQMRQAGERLASGRFVAFPVEITGTQTGPLEGLPATGAAICVQAVFYCQLDPDERLLWRIRGFFDAYASGVELGILPKRGSIREKALLMLQGYGIRLRR
ncbi:MAG TPA: ester cyclase [Solirubrobacteraceae bacterium]|nr:ester cyclase [Solirubrobacteraceae bacterium]